MTNKTISLKEHQAILEHNEQYQFEQGWMQGRQEARKELIEEIKKMIDKEYIHSNCTEVMKNNLKRQLEIEKRAKDYKKIANDNAKTCIKLTDDLINCRKETLIEVERMIDELQSSDTILIEEIKKRLKQLGDK